MTVDLEQTGRQHGTHALCIRSAVEADCPSELSCDTRISVEEGNASEPPRREHLVRGET